MIGPYFDFFADRYVVARYHRARAVGLVLGGLFVFGAGAGFGISKAVVWAVREDLARSERESVERQTATANLRSLAADVGSYCREAAIASIVPPKQPATRTPNERHEPKLKSKL
jgi:hypothetical protein